MNKKTLITILLLLSSFTFAQSDINKFVEKTRKVFEESMLTNAGEMVLPLYADDAVSFPSYQPMLKGKDALKAQIDMDKQVGFKVLKFKLTTMDIVESGDLAIETGTYDMSMEMPGMPEATDDQGKYITIYQKIDGEWKIKYDMWNTDLNPWGSMGGGDEHNESEEGEM